MIKCFGYDCGVLGMDVDAKCYLVRAWDVVGYLTHGRGVDAAGACPRPGLTDFQREAVLRAVELVARHLEDLDESGVIDVASYSLHGVRVDMRRRKRAAWEVAGCGEDAWRVLSSSGLMCGVI